ncbi:MAG: CD225/dispanin family protein [Paludibacteraceae bacterium]|nr:CD225/dispanin family protein [Paludibacteraceae bacterium]
MENQLENQNVQPQAGYKPRRPDNYLVWAILSTVCCCVPFGIVSIVFSSKVDRLYDDGEYEEAQMTADKAKKWAVISAASAAAFVLLYIIFIVAIIIIDGPSGLNDFLK